MDAGRYRSTYGDYSGGLSVTPFIGTTTLASGKTNHAIYVQRLSVHAASGLAGVTWSVEDSAGKPLSGAVSVATGPAQVDYDFGAAGVALTTGADLTFVPSATGVEGTVTWDAYRRQVGTVAL